MIPGSPFFRDISFRSILLFLLACILVMPSAATSWNKGEAHLSKSLALTMGLEIMHYNKHAALSITLVADEETLWTLELGYADPAAKKPVTKETLFGIGSVSKIIAAAAAMKLVDQGLMHLETPLTEYLPDFSMLSPEHEDITVRMLLNHSSGLPGFNCRGSVTDMPWPEYQSATYQLIKQSKLKHRPGYMHVYCNDGYTLLERVVQAVTGISFADYVQQEIFAPLEMTSSFFTSGIPPGSSIAKGFHKGRELPLEVVNSLAAAGVYSTPQDIARFIAMIIARGELDGTRIISTRSLEAMEQDQTSGSFRVVNSDYLKFGLGWDNTSHPGPGSLGMKALTKHGGTINYSAELWILPEEKLGLTAVAVNIAGVDLEDMAEKIIMSALIDKGVLKSMPEPIGVHFSQPVAPSQDLLDSIAGYYAGSSSLFKVSALPGKNIRIDMRVRGRWLNVQPNLIHHKNGQFISEDDPNQKFSFPEADGRTYLVVHYLTDFYVLDIPIAQRLHMHNGTPLAPAWVSRLNKAWLMANDISNSYTFYFNTYPKLNIEALDDLPGYLHVWEPCDYMTFAASQDDDVAGMALQIPMNEGRDLSDLKVVRRGDEDWLSCSGYLFRPLETIPSLEYGACMKKVTVKEQHLTEWLRLESAEKQASMTLTAPDNVRWKLFGAAFHQIASGCGSVDLTIRGNQQYHVALYADPGQTIDVSWGCAEMPQDVSFLLTHPPCDESLAECRPCGCLARGWPTGPGPVGGQRLRLRSVWTCGDR